MVGKESFLKSMALLALPGMVFGDATTVWFSQPGNDMHDAIPIGNGRLGAMIYGIVGEEKITLNEDSVWSGGFTNRVNDQSLDTFAETRSLLDSGDYAGADNAYLEGLVGVPPGQRIYQTAGQLTIATGHSLDDGGIYNRSLSVANSVASTTYQSNGVLYSREAVANFPTGVLAFRFEGADSKVSLNVTLERSQGTVSQTTEDHMSVLIGQGTDDSSFTFASGVRVQTDGGQ